MSAHPEGSPVAIQPRATYRLQFHRNFGFAEAASLAPYLARLGISHVYASPIFAARAGSMHGYDGTDPTRINPELGGEDGFLAFSEALRAQGLGLVVDFVPNHLAVGPQTPWWMSVLKEGPASPFAEVFDIDWARGGGKVLLPVLGTSYGEALEAGELVPDVDETGADLVLRYFDAAFPLREGSLPDDLAASVAGGTLSLAEAAVRLAVPPGDRARAEALHAVLERQHWRIAWWRTAWSDINYRRFFEIDALAGLRIEVPSVFDAVHGRLISLIRDGRVQGVRIDHVDGLADPEGYLRRLRRCVGPGILVVVEKILAGDEPLRPWPVEGTTGYEVLNWIDGVLVDRGSRAVLEDIYAHATGDTRPMEAHLREAKRLMLRRAFAGEVAAILGDLAALAALSWHTRDLMPAALDEALRDIVCAFPVYRTYRTEAPPSQEDLDLVARVLEEARRMTRAPETAAHAFIADVLRSNLAGDDEASRLRARIVRRLQQLTGPVMAKSLEDTAFYRHVPLLALNEVGGEPDSFGLSPGEFHARIIRRAGDWPAGWIATTTHDTKRSEDNRSRLLALTHRPQPWREAVTLFLAEAPSPAWTGSGEAPDTIDRVLILQALLGTWPRPLLGQDGEGPSLDGEWADFAERMQAFALKAIREAKRRTAWTHQDPAYEQGIHTFIAELFSGERRTLRHLRPLAAELEAAGAGLSLVRTVLKLTLPGVPDFYQGTELWSDEMVDPDNRRPVDYGLRARMLDDGRSLADLVRDWRDGGVKLRVIHRLLEDRRAYPAFWAGASYGPWPADPQQGDGAGLGYLRDDGTRRVLVLVSAVPARPLDADLRAAVLPKPAGGVVLPPGRGPWTDLLTGRVFKAGPAGEPRDLFRDLPVVVLAAPD